LQNEQQFNQALQSPQVPEQFKTLLRQAKANPQSLDQLLAQQLNPETVRNQGRAEIQRRRQEVEQKAQQEVWQNGVRVGMRSLLLSIGYIAIGWTGLRSMRTRQIDRSIY
jgi:ribosomal protein L16 Arg81 hydroxylase